MLPVGTIVSQQKGFKVRIASRSWHPGTFTRDGILYSEAVPLEEADGLIGLYDPMEELLTFKGPKLWYSYEPQWHSHYRKDPVGKRLVKELTTAEWVYYANPDPRYRVPHITLASEITKVRSTSVRSHAAAVVANYGGRLWFLKNYIRLRNRMILCPLVELYGRPDNWDRFRHFPALWRREPPGNYVGEAPGSHIDETFLAFLSGFKVCLCLENSCEPHYFTEKFVNAARAGCIPVYHAHPTVRERFLMDARWVDPADFDFSPRRTVDHALAQDIESFRQVNDRWLDSGVLDETTTAGFWNRICAIMREKLEHCR